MRKIFLLVALPVIVAACNRKLNNEPNPEAPSLDFTIYTPSAELFVEFKALIPGDSTKFGAHLTRLADYKPFHDGTLTVSLKGNDHTQSAQSGVSAVAGIFRPVLVPEKEGIYSLIFEWTNNSVSERFVIDSIAVYSSVETTEKQIHENHPEAPTAIRFTKEQAWKTEFETMVIDRQPFGEVIYTSGQIMPANGDEATVVAPFAGIVSFSGTSLVSGNSVSSGQKLLALSGKGLAGDNISVRYHNLKSEYEKSKANHERMQKLVQDKIVSEREFLEAKAAYEQSKAAFDNVNAASDGDKMAIYANLTGFVKNVFVTEGEYVEAGDALVSIAQNKRLMIRADVSQTHWHCLPDVTEANFLTPYDGTIYNTGQLGGKLLSYSQSASNSSWSAPVYFEVNNTGGLISGSYIEIYLLANSDKMALAVPKSALTEEQGNFFLFVQLGGESFEKREVKTGVSNGTSIEIIAGLNPGERIVSKGAYQVKLASVSSALPSYGHDH